MGELGNHVVLPRATRATLVLAVLAAAGCKAPPPRPPLIDSGGVVRDGGTDANVLDALVEPVDAAPIDAAPIDAAPIDAAPVDAAPVDAAPVDAAPVDAAPVDASVPPDAGPTDAGSEPMHPGTGTWSACIPAGVNRICYFIPAAIAVSGTDTLTLPQRITIDVDGRIHEAGSAPPFDLRVAPTGSAGEHPSAGATAAGGGTYFELLFLMGTELDGWVACNPGPRRFRVLRGGTANVALEFELDCTAMPGVQIRGALLGGTAFSGWRTDPIDGL